MRSAKERSASNARTIVKRSIKMNGYCSHDLERERWGRCEIDHQGVRWDGGNVLIAIDRKAVSR